MLTTNETSLKFKNVSVVVRCGILSGHPYTETAWLKPLETSMCYFIEQLILENLYGNLDTLTHLLQCLDSFSFKLYLDKDYVLYPVVQILGPNVFCRDLPSEFIRNNKSK